VPDTAPVTLATLRALAEATGEFAGVTFFEVDPDDWPAGAVYREVAVAWRRAGAHGRAVAFPGTAADDELPWTAGVMDGHRLLKEWAEARALRKAFPECRGPLLEGEPERVVRACPPGPMPVRRRRGVFVDPNEL